MNGTVNGFDIEIHRLSIVNSKSNRGEQQEQLKKEMLLLSSFVICQDLLSKGQNDIRELQSFAAQLRGKGQLDGPLRWMSSMAASFLLTQSMALQPAHAGDAVNYSDFMESVNMTGDWTVEFLIF